MKLQLPCGSWNLFGKTFHTQPVPRQHTRKQRHYFAKGLYSQSYDFSSSLIWMGELEMAERPRIDVFELWC